MIDGLRQLRLDGLIGVGGDGSLDIHRLSVAECRHALGRTMTALRHRDDGRVLAQDARDPLPETKGHSIVPAHSGIMTVIERADEFALRATRWRLAT